MYVFLDYLCCFLNSKAMIALIQHRKLTLKTQINPCKTTK